MVWCGTLLYFNFFAEKVVLHSTEFYLWTGLDWDGMGWGLKYVGTTAATLKGGRECEWSSRRKWANASYPYRPAQKTRVRSSIEIERIQHSSLSTHLALGSARRLGIGSLLDLIVRLIGSCCAIAGLSLVRCEETSVWMYICRYGVQRVL